MPSVRANGITLEYESMGDPRDPAMVLIMGLGVQMILWPDAFCELLAARGFHVLRFDNRDAGLSSSMDHLGTPRLWLEYAKYMLHVPVNAPYRIDDMARDTVGFLDALAIERAHVVGASMGGMIAQNMAADFPARVASLTSIMSTTGSRKLPPPERRALRALMQPPARAGDIEGATRRFMNVLRAIGSQTYPPDEAELRAFCERHARRAQNPAGQIRQLVAIAASGDRTATVRNIRVPTLVIHGDEDPLLRPACGIATARAIEEGGGDVTLEIVKGMGHDLPVPLQPRLADLVADFAARASTTTA
ncbi:MAG: alpha/beta fold hydrolase [Bacillota bacterium]